MPVINRQFVVAVALTGLLSACSLIAPSSHEVEVLTTDDNLNGLISFDLYVENDIIHNLIATTSNHGDVRIVYRYSEDNGRNWQRHSDLSHLLEGKLESKLGNDIQLAADGNHLMVVWQVEGELPGMGPLKFFTSTDGGQSWSAAENPFPNAVDQSHTDLAAGANGLFHLVWLDDRDENGYQGIRYARSHDGNHWQAHTIDDSSCSCCWNRLLVTDNGRINALYRDMAPRDMTLAQSSDSGESWQRPSTVGAFNWNFDGCPHNGGAITAVDSSHLHSLVWTGAEPKPGLYYLQSTDGGQSWSPPQAMQTPHPAFHSDLAALADGRLLAIWDSRGTSSEVIYSITNDSGFSWSKPMTLSTAGAAASMPRLASGVEGWLAMWAEQTAGSNKRLRSALIK